MDFKPPSSVIFHTANGRKIEVTDGQMAKVRSILWRKNDSDSNMKHITVNTDNRTRMKTSKYFSNTNTNVYDNEDKENIIESSSMINNNNNNNDDGDNLMEDIDDDFYDDIFISSSSIAMDISTKNESTKKRYCESSSSSSLQQTSSKRKRLS